MRPSSGNPARGDGTAQVQLGEVTLKIDPTLPVGIRRLELADCAAKPKDISGLSVVHVDGESHPKTSAPQVLRGVARSYELQEPQFVLDVVGVDHVVVLADDVRATCAEIERVSGAPLKRVKEGQRGTQGFHRLGSVILEVVERRLVEPKGAGSLPTEPRGRPSDATYWGFVIVVADIDAAAQHLGPDVIGMPKHAVQEGRRIATVRSGAGLGVPLALMSA